MKLEDILRHYRNYATLHGKEAADKRLLQDLEMGLYAELFYKLIKTADRRKHEARVLFQ
jgi:hypothetical protein